MSGGPVHPVAKKSQFPGVGRREGTGADDENARLGAAGSARRFDAIEVEVVEVTKGKGFGALLDLHPVVNATAHKARTLEGFLARSAYDKKGVVALVQARTQVFAALLAEQAHAEVGVIEVAKPEFNEGFTAFQANLFGHHL